MVQSIQRFYQSMISDCIDLVCSLSRISTDKMTTIQNKTKRSFSCSCRIPQFVIRNSTMDGFAPTLGKPRNFGFGTKCTYAKESHQKANHALRIRRQSQKITTSSRCSSINRLLDGRTLRCCGHSFTSQKSRFISTIGTVAAATCKSLPVTSNQ